MKDGKEIPNKRIPFFHTCLPAVSFALLLFLVRYLYIREFGLYEDDFSRIPGAMQDPFEQILLHLKYWIFHFRGQGRPLHETFILLFSHIGGLFGSLQVLYIIGFTLTWMNSLLFYQLLQLAASRSFAYLTVLIYLLYSADTTQVYLTHSLGVQPAITFFLLAGILFLKEKPVFAYCAAILSLITYETFFLLLLPLPFLKQPLCWKRWPEYLRHVFIMGLILVGDFILRMTVSETRIMTLGKRELLLTPIKHSIAGPVYSFGSFFYRSFQVLHDLQIWDTLILFGLATFILTLLSAIRLRDAEAKFYTLNLFARDLRLREEIFLAFIGIIFLILAYPLTFTIDPSHLSGRASRVHLAGGFGSAMLFSSMCLILLRSQRSHLWKKLILVVISLQLSALAVFGIRVQRDYVTAWEYQRRFWASLVYQIGDADEGDVILVDGSGILDVEQIGANTWNVPRILPQLFDFPEEWEYPPMAYRVLNGAWEEILNDGSHLELNHSTISSPSDTLHDAELADVIIFSSREGTLARMAYAPGAEEYPTMVENVPLALPCYPRTILFDLLGLDQNMMLP